MVKQTVGADCGAGSLRQARSNSSQISILQIPWSMILLTNIEITKKLLFSYEKVTFE